MKSYDIADNPSVLFNASLKAGDFLLSGIRLGDPGESIGRDLIYDTGFYTSIGGYDSLRWSDGKTVGVRDGVEKEVTLDERIDLVMANDGWLMAGGGRYRIEAGRVAEFRIDNDLLSAFLHISEGCIEECFGKPDAVEEDGFDTLTGPLGRTYRYYGRMMRVHWDCAEEGIDAINIGPGIRA